MGINLDNKRGSILIFLKLLFLVERIETFISINIENPFESMTLRSNVIVLATWERTLTPIVCFLMKSAVLQFDPFSIFNRHIATYI